MLRQLCSPSVRLLGLNTTHQFPTARVFPHVNTAFGLFEAEATNLPCAQLFRTLPRAECPVRPAFMEAVDAHAVSPLSVAHTGASNEGKRTPRKTGILSVIAMFQ
jgi:hypothetical protein